MRNYMCNISRASVFALMLLLWASVGLAQTPAVRLQDEGTTQGFVDTLNCTGAGLTCTKSGGIGIINGSAGGGGYATVQDETAGLTQRTTINFTGAGVTCVDNGGATRTDCTITGGGAGAPTNATYWVGAADATLTNEINLGALGTGFVINTAGTPSIYAGVTCTNQVLRILGASGAGTCVTIDSTYTSGTFPATAHNLLSSSHGDTLAASVVRGDIIRGNTTPAWSRLALGGNNLYLKSNATDLVYSTLAAGGVGACTNQAVTALNADAVPTCTTLTSAYVDSSLVPSTRTISTVAPLSGGGDLTANRTITTSMSTDRFLGRTTAGTGVVEEISVSSPLELNLFALRFSSQTANFVLAAPDGVNSFPSFRALVDADIPNTITVNLAATATALAADPADCAANNFAISINASGTLGCAQPALGTGTTGTLAISRGGTGQTTITTNQLYVGTALDTLAAKTLPSCSNATTSKLLYDNATQTFSCGTDQTGGGGGSANVAEVSLSLGTEMGLFYSTTVTGATWVTASSVIACSMFGTTADGQTPETIAVAGIVPTVSDRVVGTGFNLNVMNPNGATGTVRAHCTGA